MSLSTKCGRRLQPCLWLDHLHGDCYVPDEHVQSYYIVHYIKRKEEGKEGRKKRTNINNLQRWPSFSSLEKCISQPHHYTLSASPAEKNMYTHIFLQLRKICTHILYTHVRLLTKYSIPFLNIEHTFPDNDFAPQAHYALCQPLPSLTTCATNT